ARLARRTLVTKSNPRTERLLAIVRFAREPRLEKMTAAQARLKLGSVEWIVRLLTRRARGVRVTNESLSLPGRSLAIRLYRSQPASAASPLVVFFHGGGWVSGDLDSHDGLCRHVAEAARAVVVAVDYRLAPEHPFPAAADDAFDATVALAARAPSLGCDPNA